jgi:hypothetical protein
LINNRLLALIIRLIHSHSSVPLAKIIGCSDIFSYFYIRQSHDCKMLYLTAAFAQPISKMTRCSIQYSIQYQKLVFSLVADEQGHKERHQNTSHQSLYLYDECYRFRKLLEQVINSILVRTSNKTPYLVTRPAMRP